jgi:hypothetical protein
VGAAGPLAWPEGIIISHENHHRHCYGSHERAFARAWHCCIPPPLDLLFPSPHLESLEEPVRDDRDGAAHLAHRVTKPFQHDRYTLTTRMTHGQQGSTALAPARTECGKTWGGNDGPW